MFHIRENVIVLALVAHCGTPWLMRPSYVSATLPHASYPRLLPIRAEARVPPLRETPPQRIGLLIEPTPFTHVSGYSNRFKELLKYLGKANDVVEIVTVDDVETPPEKFGAYPINTISGFRFPLYNEICLTFDIKQRAVFKSMRRFKPELIHCTSPGFIVFIAVLTAKWLDVPLVLSYHTHLPIYTKEYVKFLPSNLGEAGAWQIIRWVHAQADLTLVTSPQMKEEFEANGVERVDVWRKGVDTDKFDPSFCSSEMRAELSDGHPDAPLLIYVGRLGSEKNLRELRQLLDAIPEARLALVGKGPAEAELKELFKGTNTKFMGLMSGLPLSQVFPKWRQ